MSAAIWPRDDRAAQRLLIVDARGASLRDATLRDLPEVLDPADLVVLNDAATLPASFDARDGRGHRFELRLAAVTERSPLRFRALVLGAGDWRVPTEHRGPAPPLEPGARVELGRPGPTARVVRVDLESERPSVVTLQPEQTGAAFWDALYRAGNPIQYSYTRAPLRLFHVQNVFASRPWAFEVPSAAFGFDWETLLRLRARGVQVRTLTHGAGISSTGSDHIDARLPFDERYEVPRATWDAVLAARRTKQRVVAVGTTVVRALESVAASGQLAGAASLVVGPTYRPKVVDTVLSGIHDRGSSHHQLLRAFASDRILAAASRHATSAGYLQHEFGDAALILSSHITEATMPSAMTQWG